MKAGDQAKQSETKKSLSAALFKSLGSSASSTQIYTAPRSGHGGGRWRSSIVIFSFSSHILSPPVSARSASPRRAEHFPSLSDQRRRVKGAMQVAQREASPAQLPMPPPAPGAHESEEGTKASRILPPRGVKRITPYTRQDFGEDAKKGEFERSRSNWDWFDTTPQIRARTKAVTDIGKVRRQLAQSVHSGGSAAQTAPSLIAELPKSMTFGDDDGVGAGFYDEAGNVHRNLFGSIRWIVCQEVGQEKGVGRDGEDYYTPAELVCTRRAGDRAATPCSPPPIDPPLFDCLLLCTF